MDRSTTRKSSCTCTRMRDIAYVALGSNLGDRHGYLERARAALAALPGTRLLRESSIEETEPLGLVPQSHYLNQMVALETTLTPRELLTHLLDIERSEGRTRETRWGPRTIDLDIVRFEVQTVNEPDLCVPHPQLPNRDFWRREIDEIQSAR
jgi:2-amino-4-hydroxy-6-hydroxymethyldihydropteridine diphosphokinase